MSKELTYKTNILKELFLNGSLSCAELSESTGRSVSLIMKMVGHLLNAEVIRENGLAPSKGGRRPVNYSLLPDSFYLIGIAMDQFVTRIAIIDGHKNFVTEVHQIELDLASNLTALDDLAICIEKTVADSGISPKKIVGIGIGMPGFIDPDSGTNYTFLGTNIRKKLQTKTQLPVFIENDSSAIALAEYKLGDARKDKNVMVVNLSWGIGLGMIIDHKLFRGNEGFAGEFSHIPIFKNGKLCSCGKIGCLETETSLSYMLEKAKEEILAGRSSILGKTLLEGVSRELHYQAFMDAARSGDPLAIEIISNAGYNIGRGIAILIHIMNPGKIVLSGRCSAAGHIWLPPIQRAINEFCIPRLVSKTQIVTSSLNHNAEILGSALLVIENLNQSSLGKLLKISTND